MAQINATEIAKLIAQSVAGGGNASDPGREFEKFLKNGNDSFGFGASQRGVVMCYGTEGFPAILRAYRNLQLADTPAAFGARIAEALQSSLTDYPAGEHNLVYAHFRLHGLCLANTDQVAAKILDNSRIIKETLELRQKLIDNFVGSREPRLPNFYFILMNGLGDDFEGLSLQLFRKADGTLASQDVLFAKAGFYIDATHKTAYVANCQGRTAHCHEQGEAARKRERLLGREFGHFTSETGLDPRAYVLRDLFGFLHSTDIHTVRAIRPQEHVMNIGGHHGFKGTYDPILEQAGMRIENETYRCINLPIAK